MPAAVAKSAGRAAPALPERRICVFVSDHQLCSQTVTLRPFARRLGQAMATENGGAHVIQVISLRYLQLPGNQSVPKLSKVPLEPVVWPSKRHAFHISEAETIVFVPHLRWKDIALKGSLMSKQDGVFAYLAQVAELADARMRSLRVGHLAWVWAWLPEVSSDRKRRGEVAHPTPAEQTALTTKEPAFARALNNFGVRPEFVDCASCDWSYRRPAKKATDAWTETIRLLADALTIKSDKE